MKKFKEFNTWVVEKDEHKKSSTYKKLTPKMKKAVDDTFSSMEKRPGDFLKNTFKNKYSECQMMRLNPCKKKWMQNHHLKMMKCNKQLGDKL